MAKQASKNKFYTHTHTQMAQKLALQHKLDKQEKKLRQVLKGGQDLKLAKPPKNYPDVIPKAVEALSDVMRDLFYMPTVDVALLCQIFEMRIKLIHLSINRSYVSPDEWNELHNPPKEAAEEEEENKEQQEFLPWTMQNIEEHIRKTGGQWKQKKASEKSFCLSPDLIDQELALLKELRLAIDTAPDDIKLDQVPIAATTKKQQRKAPKKKIMTFREALTIF